MKKINKLLKKSCRSLDKQGFTLVELIIVIAIIAVLAVAAFMMLTKWLGKSRDSRRLSDLGTIARGLTVGYSDTDDGINMYPTVENQLGSIELLSGAETVGYQGLVDDDVATAASMQKAPKDPSDESYYTYLVSQNRQKFQLLAFLEDGSEVSVLNNAYALEYEKMTPTTKGFDLGIVLRASDNMPANLIGGTLTGIDLASATEYKAVVKDDDIRFGTGVATAPIVKEEIIEEQEDIEEIETPQPVEGTCIAQPYEHAVYTEGNPVEPDTSWQNTNVAESCYYTCETNYSGDDCSIFDGEVVLLIHGDTNISDASGKGNAITAVGHTHVTTTKMFGAGSIYFDGDGDYLKITGSENLNLGIGDFTIDFWVNMSTSQVAVFGDSTYRGLINYRAGAFNLLVGKNTGLLTYGTQTDIRGAWHHLALTRENGVLRIYIDGIKEVETNNTNYIDGLSDYIYIFEGQGDYPRTLQGYLDEFRIVKGKAIRTGETFNKPTSAY